MNLPTTSIILLASLLLMACDNKPASSPNSMASNTSTTVTTDAWLGKWIGPEGTFMEITGGNGIYEITIQDLDGRFSETPLQPMEILGLVGRCISFG